MLIIDLPADLNMEDDDGLNISLLKEALHPEQVKPGSVLVAGRRDGWAFVKVHAVDREWGTVHFEQIGQSEAESLTSLNQAA